MSVYWGDYVPFQPGVRGLRDDLPRKAARQAFKRLISEKTARIEELRKLLDVNGIELSASDEGLQVLNDWFRENVEPNESDPGRLRNLWYAVVNDIGLFLGDVMIERAPGLRWEFFTWGRKNVSYQRHVIMGFSQISFPTYNVDIDAAVAVYGQRIIAGQEVEKDAFRQWVEDSVRDA